MKTVLLCLAAVICLSTAPAALAQVPPAGAKETPAELIRRVATTRDLAQSNAYNKLIELGWPGYKALLDGANSDSQRTRELALKAQAILDNAVLPQWDHLLNSASMAFNAGDHETMANLYGAITFTDRADWEQCLWSGHARQLAGRWQSAADHYRIALYKLEKLIADGPPPAVKGGGRMGRPGTVEDVAPMPRPLDEADRDMLVARRADLIILIARILRYECHDLDTASAILSSADDMAPDMNRQLSDLRADYEKKMPGFLAGERVFTGFPRRYGTDILEAWKEIASIKAEQGKYDTALEAASMVHLFQLLCMGHTLKENTYELIRMWPKLSPEDYLPNVQGLICLTEQNPTTSLVLADAKTLANAFRPPSNTNTPFWRFLFVAEPGKELATMEFSCDIEQMVLRFGGHFKCEAILTEGEDQPIEVGSIGWSDDKTGRKWVTKTFDIPPGTAAVVVTTGRSRGNFAVHEVKVTATFRPAGKPQGAVPNTHIQQEFLPAGGTVTRNGEPYYNTQVAMHGAPGKYTYTFEHPDRENAKKFRVELDLLPGRRYGLFCNLDSPFEWQMTNLAGFVKGYSSQPSLVRLKDGTWLLAFCGTGNKIMLSTSKDLVRWETPWPLPFNSFFSNVAPTLFVHDDEVFLAYFSNRLYLDTQSSAGYWMWITKSADGKGWSNPKPIAISEENGSWPKSNIEMFGGPKGRCWIIWNKYVGTSYEAPDKIEAIAPLNMPLRPDPQTYIYPGNTSTLVGTDGKMHMVFQNHDGLYHSFSADGTDWSPPQRLVEPEPNRQIANPRLIADGKQAVLIWEGNGVWMAPIQLTDTPVLGQRIKISNHVVPLNGSRPFLTADKRIVLLTGGDTVWLLTAPLAGP